jgi:hypothetical protein
MSDDDLVGVERRLRNLCDDHEHLINFAFNGATDDGAYYLTLRTWGHPNVDDAAMISLRFAYLTFGDGRDGWYNGAAGINIRVPEGRDPVDHLWAIAQFIGQGSKLLDAGAVAHDSGRLDEKEA